MPEFVYPRPLFAHEPSDRESKLARRRVVDFDGVEGMINAVVTALVETMREKGRDRLGDGGCLRSIPMDDEGFIPSGGDARAGWDSATAFCDAQAAAFRGVVLDWSEVERFTEGLE